MGFGRLVWKVSMVIGRVGWFLLDSIGLKLLRRRYDFVVYERIQIMDRLTVNPRY